MNVLLAKLWLCESGSFHREERPTSALSEGCGLRDGGRKGVPRSVHETEGLSLTDTVMCHPEENLKGSNARY